MHYVGAIDEPDENRITGWAVTQFGDICTVTAIVNGQQRFTVQSHDLRPDLAAKQQSRGAGGFRIDIASALAPGPNRIEITCPDGCHLPGSPIYRMMPADWVAPPMLKLAPAVPRLTLAELEDISLDDVSHAVAHGIVDLHSPRRSVAEAPRPSETVAAAPEPEQEPALGWLARLARRRR